MNMFKKGPEIKLPELKMPDFLLDLYYDLRERHLLPLVALLAVAIVAVPIALSQSSGSEGEEASAADAAVATPSAAGSSAGVLVAKSAPGLRDYERRLRHLHAKDPFAQQEDEAAAEAASDTTAAEAAPEASGGGATEVSGSGSSPSSGSPEPSSPSPAPASGDDGEPVHGPGDITYFSYAIDVRVVPGGSQDGAGQSPPAEATVRRNLPELTMLPSRDTPAIIYMGSTKDGKKALMLVSSNVEAIFGDGKCILGSDTCELLALEPGLPETFVYGGAGRTYKIELLKVHLVTTDELNRAPLGKPKKSKSGKSD